MKNAVLFLTALLLGLSACQSSSSLIRVSPEDDLVKVFEEAESGSTIRLEKKTYQLSRRLELINKEKLTIEGNGAEILLDNPNTDVLFMAECKDIVLKDFMAKHNDPQGPVGCSGNVLHIMDCSNVLVDGCELNGSGVVGISAYNTDLNVKDCHLHNNSECPIVYMGPSIALAGNLFENNGTNAIYFEYVEKEEEEGWPPAHKISSDTQLEGLLMRNNVFK